MGNRGRNQEITWRGLINWAQFRRICVAPQITSKERLGSVDPEPAQTQPSFLKPRSQPNAKISASFWPTLADVITAVSLSSGIMNIGP